MATNISIPTYGFVNHILALNEGNWRRFFKPFITDSVQNGLATIAGANMTVYVSAGECRCGAVMGILDEMIALDIADGDSTYNRIDSVIVQYTYGEPSTLAVAIVQGIPSANPVPPTLTKVYDTLWQMEIAQILVPSGATSSSELTITDKRVIYESIESIIDDNTESEERTWSSQKTHEEIVSLSSEIYDSLNTKADAITRTVSGNIVTFADGANGMPVENLVVGIDPVQDLHGYSNPWPAGGGKNLLNPDTVTWKKWRLYSNTFYALDDSEGNITITKNTNGSVTVVIGQNYYGIGFELSADANQRTFSISGATAGLVALYDSFADGATAVVAGNTTSVTIPANTSGFVAFRFLQGTYTFYPQLENGSSKTDYAPYSNICPISGHTSAVVTRTGKNLLSTMEVGGLGNTGLNVSSSQRIRTVGYIPVEAGKTYFVSGYATTSGKTAQFSVSFYTKNDFTTERESYQNWTNLESGFTVPNGIKFARVIFRYSDNAGVSLSSFADLQLELGSSATSYQPYQEQVTIDLNGTRYGGMLNVLTGEMTVTKGYAEFDGSNDETWSIENGEYFICNNIIPYNTWAGSIINPGSLNFAISSIGHVSYGDLQNHAGFGVAFAYGVRINVPNCDVQNGATVSDLRTYLSTNPFQVCIQMKTPLTVQLTPAQMQTLLGNNAIWADTGNIVNLTYRTDTKTYIEQKVADTNRKTCEMITIVTDKMVAPDNLTVGDLVIVNDGLYKVINSNIASGEAMVVGTNVMKITLAEYIQSLI